MILRFILILFSLLIFTNITLAEPASEDEEIFIIEDYEIYKADTVSYKYGFTLDQENSIGFKYSIPLIGLFGYYNDKPAETYVNEVLQNIISKSKTRSNIKYKAFILDTTAINSYCLPGGYIFITKGLLKILDNEAELAGLLAHQIAHIEKGNSLKIIADTPDCREAIQNLKLQLPESIKNNLNIDGLEKLLSLTDYQEIINSNLEEYKNQKKLKCSGILQPFTRKYYTFDDYLKYKDEIKKQLPNISEVDDENDL
ncbi:MAG: M48 family metalloprotease [Cyanobacteriota bacterium]